MNIFYTPDINGSHYTLNENESKHCIRVLRKTKGDEIILVDGKGGYYQTTIIDDNPKRCSIEVKKTIPNFGKRNYSLHLAIAPTKNIDRFEWFIEKATEIGIDEITPLLCEHSERKQINNERLEKILISAMKQSLKAQLPKLNNLTNFETLISGTKCDGKFIAHCEEEAKQHLFTAAKPFNNSVVLIGPEGDFSTTEIQKAIESGFKAVTLGESRLRTETAGVVTCEIIRLANEITLL